MKNELKVGENGIPLSYKFKSVIFLTVFSLILSCSLVTFSFAANVMEDKVTISTETGVNEEMNDALQQTRTITGKVVDEDGVTLPGVSVVVKGSTTGTVTNIDGEYSLNVPSSAKVLVFSFIGMTSQEVVLGSQNQINVTLEQSVTNLDEVVAIGYGSMERSNVTGAIASIKTNELAKAPVANVVEALRGQVSGVKISRGSGQPGSEVGITIRGKRSLGVGDDDDGIDENAPLLVIDGVPFTGGNLSDINPADIENINVLKDAAAASIYGASASNGVILITTKNGSFGKSSISVEAAYGITDLAMRPTMFNGEEFYQLKRQGILGNNKDDKVKINNVETSLDDLITNNDPAAVALVLTDPVEYKNYLAGNSVDWHDVLLRMGNTKNVSLSISGGTDKFHYYMNGDAYLEKGIVQHSSYNRYSFRLNADYSPYKFLTVGARAQLSKSIADETGTALDADSKADFGDFVGNTPLGSLYNDDGQLMPTVKGDQFQYNPLYRYENSQVDRKRSRVYINPWVEVKIIDGLTYRMNAFAEQRFENYANFYSSVYSISVLGNDPQDNTMRFQVQEAMTYLWDNILTYNKVFNEKHSVDATLVYGIQTYDSYTLNTTGKGSSTDLLG